MKSLVNIFIICLLCVITFIHPINSQIFKLDLSREKHSKPEEQQDAKQSLFKILALDEDSYMINTKKIDFKIVDLHENEAIIKDKDLDSITCNIDVYSFQYDQYAGMMKESKLKSITPQIALDEKNLSSSSAVLMVDLDRTKLGLEYGQYLFKIRLGSENSELEHELNAIYLPETFQKHISEYPNTAMICHYFTADKKHIIPIFAPIVHGTNEFRTMLETIKFQPQIEGISSEEQFPWAFNIWYSNGVLDIKFDKAAVNSQKDKRINPLASKLLVENYKEIKGINVVNSINIHEYGAQEYVTNYAVERTPKIYVPVLINSKNDIMYSAKSMSEYESMNDLAIEFINRMKNAASDKSVLTILPKSVYLKNISMVGNTIKLDFNQDFVEYFNRAASKKLAQYFVDSAVLSFTSIDDVESIEISVNGTKITKLGDYQFPEILSKPKAFN